MLMEIVLLVSTVLLLLFFSTRRPKNFPPGPTPYPIVGNFFQVDQSDPAKVSAELYKKYGGFTGLIVPLHKVVVVNGWEALMEMLANEDCQGRPDNISIISGRFGDGSTYGIAMSEGESWSQQRRFTMETLRNLGFGKRSHESLVIHEVQELVKLIEDTNGQPHNQKEMIFQANTNITWALIGGFRSEVADSHLKNLSSSMKDVQHNLPISGGITAVFPLLGHLFPESTGYRRIMEGLANINKFIKNAIEEHKKGRETNHQNGDFIDIYLQEIEDNKADPGSGFTEKDLIAICHDMLTAGSETTSGILAFAIFFLCLTQSNQQRIYEEILENVGADCQITMDHKTRLVYAEAFLMEVSRFRPVAPIYIPHRATKNITLGGYSVPKGTVLFPVTSSVYSDEDYWGDPHNFRPDRFLSPEGTLINHERILSFGKGKRSCVGESLAKMISFITLTTIVQKFHLKLPEGPVPDSQGVPGFTVSPPNYKVIATPRCHL